MKLSIVLLLLSICTSWTIEDDSNIQKVQNLMLRLKTLTGTEAKLVLSDEDNFHVISNDKNEIHIPKVFLKEFNDKNIEALYEFVTHEYTHLILGDTEFNTEIRRALGVQTYEVMISELEKEDKDFDQLAYNVKHINNISLSGKLMKELGFDIAPALKFIDEYAAHPKLGATESADLIELRKKFLLDSYNEGWESWSGFQDISAVCLSEGFLKFLESRPNGIIKRLKKNRIDQGSLGSMDASFVEYYYKEIKLERCFYFKYEDVKENLEQWSRKYFKTSEHETLKNKRRGNEKEVISDVKKESSSEKSKLK